MQFHSPVTINAYVSQGCESSMGDFADPDFAMFSGLDNPVAMSDWLNLPSLSGDIEN
jgi:hypothetical protein